MADRPRKGFAILLEYSELSLAAKLPYPLADAETLSFQALISINMNNHIYSRRILSSSHLLLVLASSLFCTALAQSAEPISTQAAETIAMDSSRPFWVTVTILLSTTGAIGGFAWHLINADSIIVAPHIQRSPPQAYLSFFADAIIGAVTANSLHIAISGIIDYQAMSAAPLKDYRVYYNLIAIGILSGFAGAPILRSLSRRLQSTLSPEEEERVVTKLSQSPAFMERVASQAKLSEAIGTAAAALSAPQIGDEHRIARERACILMSELVERHPEYSTIRLVGIYWGRLHRQLNTLEKAVASLSIVLKARRSAGISFDKDDADLLYNRSCYNSLIAKDCTSSATQKQRIEDARDDFEKATKGYAENRQEALNDSDLEFLRTTYPEIFGKV